MFTVIAVSGVYMLAHYLLEVGTTKAIPFIIFAAEASRGYRRGEGPATERVEVHVHSDSDRDEGVELSWLAENLGELPVPLVGFGYLKGKTVGLTCEEHDDLIIQLEALKESSVMVDVQREDGEVVKLETSLFSLVMKVGLEDKELRSRMRMAVQPLAIFMRRIYENTPGRFN